MQIFIQEIEGRTQDSTFLTSSLPDVVAAAGLPSTLSKKALGVFLTSWEGEGVVFQIN